MTWDEDENEATQIFGGNDPQLDGSWQVNVTETDTRTMTAVEIGLEFGRGNLDVNDTFVWREGMRDWVALGKCPDFFAIIAQYGGQRSQSVAPPPPPRASIAPAAPMPITSFAVPTMPPPAMQPAPAPRPMQPSVPFATPPALSAGQSPLRGPMASIPPMVAGTFPGAPAVPTQFGAPGAAQALAAAQLPEPKGNGLLVGLIVGGLILVLGGAAAGYLLLRSPDPATAASTASPSVAPAPAESAKETGAAEPASATAETAAAASAEPEPSKAEAGSESGSDDSATKGASPTNQVARNAPSGYSNGSSSNYGSSSPTKPEPAKPDTKPAGEFNVNAARSALTASAGAASGCGKPGGPKGRGRATVMFSPSGSASSVSVDGPFSGTPVGSCVAAAFRGARVPPFSGGPQSVTKSFTVR